MPKSRTATATNPSSAETVTQISFEPSEYFSALSSRFWNAWAIASESMRTGGTEPFGTARWIVIP